LDPVVSGDLASSGICASIILILVICHQLVVSICVSLILVLGRATCQTSLGETRFSEGLTSIGNQISRIARY
jgi:hypothetical protein